MKVVHFLWRFNYGGIEQLVHDLVRRQKDNDELIPSILAGKPEGELTKDFISLQIKITSANFNSGYDFNPIKIFRIINIFKCNDLIHLHGFNISVALAALISGKPIIYTEHGNFGYGRRIRFADKINLFFRMLFIRFTSVIVVCNSNFTIGKVQELFSMSGPRLKLIYNGCNISAKPDPNEVKKIKSFSESAFIVGTASRLAGVKRIEKLLKVFESFYLKHHNAYLIIVGDGPEKNNLIKVTASLVSKNNISFVGYKNNVIDYQAAFDVFVLSSKNESFGLVAIQSYVVDKPVLVFADGGGLIEIISRFNEKDICVDEAKMIERLEYYYQNNKKEYNTEKVLNHFNIEKMENEYFIEYKRATTCAG